MSFKIKNDGGVSEEQDRREAERWARMTPEQRKQAEDEAYGTGATQPEEQNKTK